MAKRKFKFWIESIANDQEETVEYDDDATEEQIEEDARDFAMNYVSWGYHEIEAAD